MAKVFLVEMGERHEGGEIKSVHSTEERAKSAALRTPCDVDEGWLPAVVRGDESLRWEADREYVLVREMELNPPIPQTDDEFWGALSETEKKEATTISESVPNVRLVDIARIVRIRRSRWKMNALKKRGGK